MGARDKRTSGAPAVPSRRRRPSSSPGTLGREETIRLKDDLSEPLDVAILLMDGFLLSSVGTFLDLTESARRYIRHQYHRVDPLPEANFGVYRTRLVGLTKRVSSACGVSLEVDRTVDPDARFHLIFIPGIEMSDATPYQTISTPGIGAWLQNQREKGAVIAASGASVLILAEAKLTKGIRVAVPWWMRQQFANYFPGSKLERDDPVSEDNGIYCSSGAAADHVLATLLLMRLISPNIAQWLAINQDLDKFFPEHLAPARFPITQNTDELVVRAEAWLLQHLSRKITIADLAEALSVSRRTLIRRFTSAMGMTPINYLQAIRIDSAKRLVQHGVSVSRAGYMVGYSDTAFFRKLFLRNLGVAPEAMREMHCNLPGQGRSTDR